MNGVVRDATSTKAECSVAAKLVFIKWKTAASVLGRAAGCAVLVGKKGDGSPKGL